MAIEASKGQVLKRFILQKTMSNKTVGRAVNVPYLEGRHALETAEKSKNQWRSAQSTSSSNLLS